MLRRNVFHHTRPSVSHNPPLISCLMEDYTGHVCQQLDFRVREVFRQAAEGRTASGGNQSYPRISTSADVMLAGT